MKKILILNTYLTGGGAAIAAVRLAQALHDTGEVEVAMLTLHGDKERASSLPFRCESIVPHDKKLLRERFNFIAERAQIYLHNGYHKESLFHISTGLWGMDISDHPLVQWADIIHLHWICQGLLSMDGLRHLADLHKPVYWTLHDMWPFTAVSPHLKDPNTYESPWNGRELSLTRRVWQAKKTIYPILAPTLIGCSRWIADKARESTLTQGLRITNIPNPIDTQLFAPGGPPQQESFNLLFGAVNTSDPRKGFKEMVQALHLLRENGDLQHYHVQIHCFGHLSKNAIKALEGFSLHHHGYVKTPEEMIAIYRQAHCLVVPSLHENLPNTIMESLSCGVPCIAFKTGGIPEMITDGETGYLCEYGSAKALSQAISRMIRLSSAAYQEMRSQARSYAITHYDAPHIAQQMLSLISKTTHRSKTFPSEFRPLLIIR